MKSSDLKIAAGLYIKESKLSKEAKLQLFNFIQHEASDSQIKALLLDGKVVYLDEQAEAVVNDRFQAQENELREAGVIGNVLGILMFGPGGWAMWRTIHAAFSQAARKCGVFKISNQRDTCMTKAKIIEARKKIAFLAKSCTPQYSKNVEKCKKGLPKVLAKEKKKLAKLEAKLSKQERSGKGGPGSDPSDDTKLI